MLSLKFGVDIHSPFRLNSNNFGSTWTYDQLPAELMTVPWDSDVVCIYLSFLHVKPFAKFKIVTKVNITLNTTPGKMMESPLFEVAHSTV